MLESECSWNFANQIAWKAALLLLNEWIHKLLKKQNKMPSKSLEENSLIPGSPVNVNDMRNVAGRENLITSGWMNEPAHTSLTLFICECFIIRTRWRKVLHDLLTLGAHAQRGVITVLGLCVCVCVSVTQHLTLNALIRATNDSNLPSGGWRSKILSDFLWFVAKLERFLLVRLSASRPFFTPRKMRMRMNLDHADNGHFVFTWPLLGET